MNEKERANQPIAIIGIGCRFPGGASSPQAFWELLCQGTDAITEVPPDRWDIRRFYDPDPQKPGKTYVKHGGFLQEDLYQFDPLFFGISPREAQMLDPQQRLLLEVTWEAFEDAGLVAQHLSGSETGVFIGAFTLDALVGLSLNRDLVNSSSATSSTMTLLANRLSYVFDLRGPSLALDTACSSSLVATHYACQCLWNGECSLAIAGGVNVIWRPEYFTIISKGRFLSPEGRCMTFDERADGYVRGEGAGVVLLKPLAAALHDHDPIYALIRTTGCNQDGKTPGVAFPSQQAQERLMTRVYQQIGVSPGDIQYIEAHGTGTRAGDPVEAQALHHVLSRERAPGAKCLVGSVKTIIGHLEAAAGIAGLIKTALCLKENAIPPNLHFERPNPEIPFEQMCLRVPTALEPWPTRNGRAYAGVNSFGYGGTNAHVLLQAAPATARQEANQQAHSEPPTPLLFPLSARSAQALRELAGKYERFLRVGENEIALKDFCYSTALRRSHHAHRAAIVAQSRAQLCERLHALSLDEPHPAIASAQVLPEAERQVVFVYTGMGPQWWAMGRELLQTEPVFRERIEACDAIFSRCAGWSLLEALTAPEGASRMAETQAAQPANFALQTALTDLWASWGVAPDAVVGHSVGEVTAAYISGALSLEDALLVSYHRSRLQQTQAGRGAMLAVGLTEAAAQAMIAPYSELVSIAAINSPSFVTLSGAGPALQQIAGLLAERDIFHRFLRVEVAYHGPQMDPLREELLSALAGLHPKPAAIPLYSTVAGAQMQGAELHAEYWWRNVRHPVRFADTLNVMLHDHYRIFVEVGPHPVLKSAMAEAFRAAGVRAHHCASLIREKPERPTMLTSLGYLHTLGSAIEWNAIVPEHGRYVVLPTYPWQREPYWLESQRSQEDRLGRPGHVLMNQDLRLPWPAWEVELNAYFFPYLKDHRIAERVIVPGAVYVEAGLTLHNTLFPQHGCVLEDLEFHQLLFADHQEGHILHLSFHPSTNRYAVYSRVRQEGAAWIRYASGKLLPVKTPGVAPLNLAELQQRCRHEIAVEEFYTRLRRSKWQGGPSFRILRRILAGSQEALGRIRAHEPLASDPTCYWVHPTVLDAAFQVCALAITSPNSTPWAPTSIGRVTLYESPASPCWAYSRIVSQTDTTLRADVCILDDAGRVAVEVKNLCLKAVPVHPTAGQDLMEQGLYQFQWQPAEHLEQGKTDEDEAAAPELANPEHWLIFGNAGPTVNTLLEHLEARNIPYTLVACGAAYRKAEAGQYCIRPANRDDLRQVFADNPETAFNPIVYLWSLPETSVRPSLDLAEPVRHCCTVQALLQEFPHTHENLRLGIVTRNCQPVQSDDCVDGVMASPLWGLGRVIRLEYPDIQCTLIDLPQDEQGCAVSRLAELLRTRSPEVEIAFRADRIFVNRLARAALEPDAEPDRAYQSSTTEPVELLIGIPGNMDSLMYREAERVRPGQGEVEIKVHTAALNFKDILKVMGMIPATVIAETYFGTSFGMECSGTVTAVGAEVEEVAVGDEVIAATNRGCFRSYITAPAGYTFPKPSPLKLEEAPIFSVFVTAYYALIHVGRLQAGERVLIHNAAGGVGLAAVQVAQSVGAEIFATAGSDEKRNYLRSLGIGVVMDSRTLRFADEVLEHTDGQGVDVVLNALSGEALVKSFNLLAPYGRFVEIGKKAIAENAGLPMAAFNRNLTFSAVDLDRLFKGRAPFARQLFREVHQGFEHGRFHALPVAVFAAAEATQAFRYMAQSKHIGKVVLAMQAQAITVHPAPRKPQRLRTDGAYLITGGVRGFGLEIAKWLARQGARRLALISRSGVLSDEARQAVAAMETQGVRVLVSAVDVSDDQQVQQFFERMTTALGPVRGIVHGAMILRDGLLNTLNPASFREVLAPKLQGAVNLHTHSPNQPLDFFVLLSSVSSLTGNVGQANYAAANAFLDSFAHYRQAQGLPATTINWGALSEVGVLAHDEHVLQLLQDSGVTGIRPEQAVQAFGQLLEYRPAQIAVFRIDWSVWNQRHPRVAGLPLFQQLVSESAAAGDSDENEKQRDLRRKLAELDPQAGAELLQTLLAQELAAVLQLPAAKIDVHQNILHLGVDSLTAVEFTQSLQREFGLEVSTMDFMQGVSLAQMATRLLEKLQPEHERVEAGQEADDASGELLRDAVLDPAIQAAGPLPNHAAPTAILLTGATGLLGAHLLHDLCALTQARIYCLVRASSVEAGRARLDQHLAGYFADFRPADRIIPLAGDLARPRLGLSEQEFARLCAELDSIYHCGAQVNHLAPYHALRASNVSGLLEILKLASAERPKSLHYISSLVAAVEQAADGYRLDERWLTGEPPAILGGYGYAQTKWVAERLLAQAQQRGLPARIYRPGFIGGRSDNGVWRADRDHLRQMILGCLQMGHAPDSDAQLDLLPVDFLSALIVKISLCEQVPGRVFNCSHPSPGTWNDIMGWLKNAGHALTLAPPEDWRETYLRRIGPENALYPLLPFYLEQQGGAWQEWTFSTMESVSTARDNTVCMLERFNMSYPAVDAPLWQRYVGAFEQC